MRLGAFTLLCLTTLLAPLVRADTTLTADVGWGGRTRSGKWSLIYVTVSDSKSRNATLELHTPHDSSQAMSVRLPVALGPRPQSYFLYAPLAYATEPSILSLHAEGRLLKELTILDVYGVDESGQNNPFITARGPFIGTSGRGPAFASLSGSADGATVAYLEPRLLPRSWRGYDALDLLVLNQPDLVSMDGEQQKAIRDWVNVGGRLLVWPGDNPLPPSGPVVDLLPAKVGGFITVKLSKSAREQANLGDRFASFTARSVTPVAGASVHPLFDAGGAVAVTAYRGLGSVTLVNFNVSALVFDQGDGQAAAARFLDRLVSLPHSTSSNSNNEFQTGEQANAAAAMMDLMGDVPGVGTFGFGYVALVVLGMMAIVGPIDWFVLKWMRRQPWTWVTTAGWVGLITLIALSLGSLLRSGDLHFRTVSVVDQADGHVVAQTDALGLYSPRTTDYRFDVRPGTWWEPMSADSFAYGRDVIRPLPFLQDADGNVPGEDTVRVWSLRFQRGESAGVSDPVLGADLRRTESILDDRSVNVVKGKVTNLSKVTLTNLWLRTRNGSYDLTHQQGFPANGLEPGQSLAIDVPLSTNKTDDFEPWVVEQPHPPVYYRRYGGDVVSATPTTPLAVARSAGDLPADRATRVTDRLQGEDGADWVALYAEAQTPEGSVKLIDETPLRQNWIVYRALVHLGNGAPPAQP